MPTKFSELGIKPESKGLLGDKMKIERTFGKKIIVEAFRIMPSEYTGTRLEIQFTLNDNRHMLITGSNSLQGMITKVAKENFPFETIIVKQEDGSFQFT